jgi:hypothetical protein
VKPEDRKRYEQTASPEAIGKSLAQARRQRAAVQERMVWLEGLHLRRCREIAAGVWPPKPAENTQQPVAEDGNQQTDPEGSSS